MADLTVSEWAAQYRAAREALERIAGEPLVLWESAQWRDGLLHECPGYGAVVVFSTDGTTSSVEWYATGRQAQAAAILRQGIVLDIWG